MREKSKWLVLCESRLRKKNIPLSSATFDRVRYHSPSSAASLSEEKSLVKISQLQGCSGVTAHSNGRSVAEIVQYEQLVVAIAVRKMNSMYSPSVNLLTKYVYR